MKKFKVEMVSMRGKSVSTTVDASKIRKIGGSNQQVIDLGLKDFQRLTKRAGMTAGDYFVLAAGGGIVYKVTFL